MKPIQNRMPKVPCLVDGASKIKEKKEGGERERRRDYRH